MSATKLDGKAVYVKKYSIVGFYEKSSSDDLVVHVAIARESKWISSDDTILVAHMGVSEQFDVEFSMNTQARVSVVGEIPGLDPDDIDVRDAIETSFRRCQKVALLPPNSFRPTPPFQESFTESEFCFEGNCVTFVMGVFRRAEIQILSFDFDRYPVVGADLIQRILRRVLHQYAASVGMDLKIEPARMPLPGYFFHALQHFRSTGAGIGEPYVPESVDEAFFPRQVVPASA
jgi:hypothetical protein